MNRIDIFRAAASGNKWCFMVLSLLLPVVIMVFAWFLIPNTFWKKRIILSVLIIEYIGVALVLTLWQSDCGEAID